MAVSVGTRHGREVTLGRRALTGALGDSITVLPIVVALAALTSASLVHILVLFGLFQVVWGLWYGTPLSVEPMKALAGLAIAGALTYGELLAAGLLAGVVLLLVAGTGTLGRVQRVVGEPVVRGVQFAVALLLGSAGLDLALGGPWLALAGVGVAAVVTLGWSRRASALAVLACGTGAALWWHGVPALALPSLAAFPTAAPTLTTAAVEGALAQLAMTVGNAAVATALLLEDLYEVDVSPDQLAESMGAMCLAAIPLGGLPMCHGSGGLAGKHAFGARTGGANLVLGALYIAAALVAGLWLSFPMAVLGVLLGIVAVHMARVALSGERPLLVLAVGALSLLTNVGVAFGAGLAYWVLRERWGFSPSLPSLRA